MSNSKSENIKKENNIEAVLSLLFALLGLCFLAIVLEPLAFYLSYRALKVNKNNNIAKAGRIISTVSIIISLVSAMFILIF